MAKTGFRGERKRILTPSLSQGEGECGDGKLKVMRGKHLPIYILRSRDAHTQLSLATSMRGNVGMERRRDN